MVSRRGSRQTDTDDNERSSAVCASICVYVYARACLYAYMYKCVYVCVRASMLCEHSRNFVYANREFRNERVFHSSSTVIDEDARRSDHVHIPQVLRLTRN